MPVVLFGIPLALEYVGISVIALSTMLKVYLESSESSYNDEEFVDSVKGQEIGTRESIEKEANNSLVEHNDFVASDSPPVETIPDVVTKAPKIMPEYLAQQNELLQIQIQSTRNLMAQAKFTNDLLSRSIQSQIVSNANSKMIAEALSSSLPALVMQMQQVAKIPAAMKIKSDLEVAQHEEFMSEIQQDRELSAIYNSDFVNALNELKYSLSTTQSATANATAGIANNLESVSKVAQYQTTEQAIKNLDGNTVATMKPIEAQTVKNVVDAKNATDEMEFDIPDDILDDVFQQIPLPTFTHYNYEDEEEFLFKGGDKNA